MNFKLGKKAKNEKNLENETEQNSSEQGSETPQDKASQANANVSEKSPSPEQEMSESTGAVSEHQELQEKADAKEPLKNTAENLSFSPEKMSFTPDPPEEETPEVSGTSTASRATEEASTKSELLTAEEHVATAASIVEAAESEGQSSEEPAANSANAASGQGGDSPQNELLPDSPSEAETSSEEKAADDKAARKAAAARNRRFLLKLALGGVFAALYVLLAMALAPISYGILQFRLSEVLVALPLLSSAAVPGVFLGCLIANVLNPQNLGLVDIFGGSLATLAAACISYALGRGYRETLSRRREIKLLPEIEQQKIRRSQWWRRFFLLLPPVLLNMFSVGIYLPYLLLEAPSQLEIVGSVTLIGLSEAAVVYGLGLPLLLALERSGLPWQKL